MTPDTIKAVLGWLDGAEHQHHDDTGTSYRVILPDTLLAALKEHLRDLPRVMAGHEATIATLREVDAALGLAAGGVGLSRAQEVEKLKDFQRAKERTVEGLKQELENAEQARQQGWNEANYFRQVVQDIADQPCRKLLLYHDHTCPEEFTDRTKWCLACRARIAVEERPKP